MSGYDFCLDHSVLPGVKQVPEGKWGIQITWHAHSRAQRSFSLILEKYIAVLEYILLLRWACYWHYPMCAWLFFPPSVATVGWMLPLYCPQNGDWVSADQVGLCGPLCKLAHMRYSESKMILCALHSTWISFIMDHTWISEVQTW